MKILLCILLLSPLFATAEAAPTRTIQACKLEDGSEAILQAQYDPDRDADRFYLTLDGKTENAFTDMPDVDYAGKIVLSQCRNQVLIFAINYGAPYRKGAVIRRPLNSGAVRRIDFSEKALPELLYVGEQEVLLVIPNAGHEIASKYLLYRMKTEDSQPEEATGADILPPKAGFEVVRIDP